MTSQAQKRFLSVRQFLPILVAVIYAPLGYFGETIEELFQ